MEAVVERRGSIHIERDLIALDMIRFPYHPDRSEWEARRKDLKPEITSLERQELLLIIALAVLVVVTIGSGVLVLKQSR
jgi:hypothetical protein